jgi:hypothetical protein
MKLTLPLAAAAACSLALPAAADARIVVQRSIAGVTMGMSTAKVTDTLGKPDRKRTVESEILGRTSEWVYGRTRVQFSGTEKSSQVIQVETRDPEERTAAGIGLGSTKAELKRSIKKARCESGEGFSLCSVGSFRPGNTVTTFRLTPKNRVSSVSIGTVID